MPINRRTTKTVVAQFIGRTSENGRCPYFRGMTFFEIILVIAIIGIMLGGVMITFSKTLAGRNVEGETERLAALIRSAQARAAETETVQAIFLSRNEFLWVDYPNKTITEVKSNCSPLQGTQIRNQLFRNDVEIVELWLNNAELFVPDEPENGIAILIDVTGEMTETYMTLKKKDTISWLTVHDREVKVDAGTDNKTIVTMDLPQEILPPQILSNEEKIVCKTGSLNVRGWQAIQVNNTDKINELKLKVRSDIKMPSSSHYHVYVIPGTYQSKPVAHGLTGTTATYITSLVNISFLYYDVLSVPGPYVNGVRLRVLHDGIEIALEEIPIGESSCSLNLPYGVYDFEVTTVEFDIRVEENIVINVPNKDMNIFVNDQPASSSLQQYTQSGQYEQTIPLGEWIAEPDALIANAMSVPVPVFNTPKLYYLYKNNAFALPGFMAEFPGSDNLSLYRYTTINKSVPSVPFKLQTEEVKLNYFSNTGYSYFPTVNFFDFLNERWIDHVGEHGKGGVSSKLASQPVHSPGLTANEIEQGGFSSWLTIPMQDFPANTKFLKIIIAAYHQADSNEQLFNLYPSSSSTHFIEPVFNSAFSSGSYIDYQTDPMVLIYPWLKWQNSALWLSNYGYMLKPLTRSSTNSILAAIGPRDGEIYKSNQEYKNFWYGPVFLDWDKLLGEEGILTLLGWVSGVFGYDEWNYRQMGDTYNQQYIQDTTKQSHKAAPAHFLLKNFAMLPYWYMFNYTNYFPAANLTKRIQLPLNILTQQQGDFFSIWEKPACAYPPYESSSLSIELMNSPNYPLRLATLAPLFGQNKVACASDLYSSYFYVMQRINHIMLDTGAWLFINGSANEKSSAITIWRCPLGNYPYGVYWPPNGNLDKWKLELANIPDGTGKGYPRQTWWSWYTSIPWAKGTAFPIPSSLVSREGWERPVVEPYPADNLFTTGGTTLPNPAYNNIVKNQPNTIFMSTSHYPLGSIEISVKKK